MERLADFNCGLARSITYKEKIGGAFRHKRDHAIEVNLPDAQNTSALTVDESTGDDQAHKMKLADGKIKLERFAVSVMSW